MGSCATALIVLATILGPLTLVFMATSFGTNYWLVFTVDRSKLTTTERTESTTNVAKGRYYHTRSRGLFLECYPGNDTVFLDQATDKVDGYCFYLRYELLESETNVSENYMLRLHLLRLFLAFYIVGIVFFLTAFIFGLLLCCMRISRWAYVAGLCAYIASFSIAAAIAFFHGAEYMERNKITTRPEFYQMWSATLKVATRRSYGWSYALGWVGMILAAFSATFYSLAGCYITSERYEDSREILDTKSSRGGQYGYPIPMEPVYTVDDPYYGKPYGYPRGGYVGPYVYDDRRPVPAIGYPGYPEHEMWRWREVS